MLQKRGTRGAFWSSLELSGFHFHWLEQTVDLAMGRYADSIISLILRCGLKPLELFLVLQASFIRYDRVNRYAPFAYPLQQQGPLHAVI
jgi:hypothetical protein